MKIKKQFAIVASVCLMTFFSTTSFAQTTLAKSDAASARDTVAKTLEAHGLVVATDAYGPTIMQFYTGGDSVVLSFNENGADVSINGNPMSGRGRGRRNNLSPRLSRFGVDDAAVPSDDQNVAECTLLAVRVYGLSLDLCEFDTAGVDLLCIPRATFDFALDVLRCVGDIGD
jgi:hypothetical protein